MKHLILFSFATALVFFIASPLSAQSVVKGHTFMEVPDVEVQETSNGTKSAWTDATGISKADNGEGGLDFNQVRCKGISVQSEKAFRCFICEVIDNDGDMAVYYVENLDGEENSQMRMISGTGKFVGTKVQGTTKLAARLANGSYVSSWELKIKN